MTREEGPPPREPGWQVPDVGSLTEGWVVEPRDEGPKRPLPTPPKTPATPKRNTKK